MNETVNLYCDNSAACLLAEDAIDTSGKRVKHVMRRLAYLRELKKEKVLRLVFVPGENNLADIFTKPLAARRFHTLRPQLITGLLPSRGDETNLPDF